MCIRDSYRIMPAPDKMLFDTKLLYCAVFSPDAAEEFVVVYRDADRMCYGKRITIEKFIRGREYKLIRDKAGRVDLLLRPEEAGVVSLSYVPAKRQRLKGSKYDLGVSWCRQVRQREGHVWRPKRSAESSTCPARRPAGRARARTSCRRARRPRHSVASQSPTTTDQPRETIRASCSRAKAALRSRVHRSSTR